MFRLLTIVRMYAFVLILLLIAQPSFSEPLSLSQSVEYVDLKPYTQLYVGHSSGRIEDLIKEDAAFSAYSNQLPKLSSPEHWIKIRLKNNSLGSEVWYLQLGFPSMPMMHAYWQFDGSVEEISSLDKNSAYEDRLIDEPLIFLPLQFNAGETKTLFLNYKTFGDIPLSLKLFSQNGFDHYKLKESTVNYVLIGFMLAIFILVVIFALFNRSRLYFYYAGLVLFMGLIITDMGGYNHKYLWPQSDALAERGITTIMLFINLFYLLFIREMMQLKTLSNAMYTLYTVLIYIGLALFVLSAFVDIVGFLLLMAITFIPIFIYTALWSIKKHLVLSKVFALSIISHVFFVFGLFMFSILAFNPFPSININTYIGMGYGLEAIFFALALSIRSHEVHTRYQLSLLTRVDEANQLFKVEQEKNLLLQEQQEQLLKFAGTVHDIFQPLSSVRMALGALPRESEKVIKQHIDNTVSYAESILKKTMLDSRENFHKMNSRCSIGEIFSDVIARHEMVATQKNIHLRYFNSKSTILASSESLERILNNLVGNAIRYTEIGSVLLGVRLKSAGFEIQVIDTGPGMSRESLDKILKPFQQGDLKNEGRNGYGLGLHIVKNLCKQQGYELSINTEINKGSCFKIFIPD